MTKNIPLDSLVAKVEKYYNECLKRANITDSDYWNAKADAYRNVLTILNSMQEEPVSEELDEAAKRYATEGDEETGGLYIIEEEVDAFKAGSEWKEKQMMAKAINTEASYTMSVPSICISLPLGVNVGDKVKVIVIKTKED